MDEPVRVFDDLGNTDKFKGHFDEIVERSLCDSLSFLGGLFFAKGYFEILERNLFPSLAHEGPQQGTDTVGEFHRPRHRERVDQGGKQAETGIL